MTDIAAGQSPTTTSPAQADPRATVTPTRGAPVATQPAPAQPRLRSDGASTKEQARGAPPAAAPGASTQPTAEPDAPTPKMHRFKLDGADVEVDEEELKRGYGLNKVAQKRMEEAARTRKQSEMQIRASQDLVAAIRQDPFGVAREALGEEGFQKAFAKAVADQLRYERMNPEQRRVMELERDIAQRDQTAAEYQREQQERAAQQEEVEARALVATAKEGIFAAFNTALEAEGLVPDPMFHAMLAGAAKAARQAGRSFRPEDMQRVARDLKTRMRGVMGGLVKRNGENLHEFYDDASLGAVRKADATRAEASRLAAQRQPRAPTGQFAGAAAKEAGWVDMEKWRDRRRGG